MRFLDANEMIALLPAESSATAAALARISPLLARAGADRLEQLTAQGFLRTAQINNEGKPVAVLWYRPEGDRLIVDTLAAVETGRTTEQAWSTIWAGVEMIGHSYGASVIEGVTARAALARVYLAHGFETAGVLLRKKISAKESH